MSPETDFLNKDAHTILVVDDSQHIQDFVCQMVLIPAGYHVLSAINGKSALDIVRARRPDLMLLDLNLPDQSGLDVLKALKGQNQSLPTIVMTAYGSGENILQSFRLGAKNVLQKPFTDEELLEAVTDVLLDSQWQRERAHMIQALADANLELQEQLRMWTNMNVIGQTITSTLEEADVQRRLMWGINKLMRVEAGTLYLLDEQTGELVVQISLGEYMESKGGLRLKPSQGIAGWVAAHNQPALVPNVHADPRFFQAVDTRTGFLSRSALAVPLNIKGNLLGVIQVLNPTGGTKTQFDEKDLEMLEVLAATVAVALENARLYAKMHQSITVETLKHTVVTLSHYINNSLAVLSMTGQIIQDSLQYDDEGTLKPGDIQEAVALIQLETARITTILAVLDQITTIRHVEYMGDTLMIDIEPELREALKKIDPHNNFRPPDQAKP